MSSSTGTSAPTTTTQLVFPNKDPLQEAFNKSIKAIICVVCGANKHYMCHYVVRYCYHSQFPSSYKTHLPDDVVLLCVTCHVVAEQQSHLHMQQIEQKLRQQRRK